MRTRTYPCTQTGSAWARPQHSLCSGTKTFLVGLAVLIGGWATGNAQTSVTVDPGVSWIAYMNVFELPANGGGYVFGQVWGAADLNASFSGATLTLTPNTSISRDVPLSDTFWWQANGSGNKTMDANMYVQDDTLAGQTVIFTGLVLQNSLVSPYTSTAFIKDFVADYSSFTTTTAVLAPGEFSISLATAAGHHIQYGFETIGPNARLDEVAGLGFVQVTAVPEPSVAGLILAGLAGAILRRRVQVQ